ncbi:MAG: 30S ribosomal protein S27ae [Candidatus Bathyarchaeia archaeon]
MSKLYEYDYSKGLVKLKNKKCPRCGALMASHLNPVKRWTCGGCSYTEFIEQ